MPINIILPGLCIIVVVGTAFAVSAMLIRRGRRR